MTPPRRCRYRNETLTLRPGDVIFQYTDGVTEATNAAKELFGEQRLLAAAEAADDREPERLLPYLRGQIDAFVKDAPQFDDITMLALRYRGAGAGLRLTDGETEHDRAPDDL